TKFAKKLLWCFLPAGIAFPIISPTCSQADMEPATTATNGRKFFRRMRIAHSRKRRLKTPMATRWMPPPEGASGTRFWPWADHDLQLTHSGRFEVVTHRWTHCCDIAAWWPNRPDRFRRQYPRSGSKAPSGEPIEPIIRPSRHTRKRFFECPVFPSQQ